MLPAGTILKGKYKVIRLLHEGGMGFVHEGEYEGNKCIIKEPKIGEGIEKDSYFLEKIKIEAEILNKINHENIVGYIDSFEERNSFFLVEELVPGEKLGDRYYKNPGNEKEVINYTLQLLDAIKYLHNNNIKHRDINPNNLILSPDKKLILIDFGTAKYFLKGRKQIKGIPKSTMVGTSSYAPPEQWEGDTTEVSDIFSIGRTMYYMLTGELPSESPYKRLDFMGTKIRKELADIVIKAAEPEIENRFESVEQIISAVKSLDMQRDTKIIDDKRIWLKIAVGAIAVLAIIFFMLPGNFMESPKIKVTPDLNIDFGTISPGESLSLKKLSIENEGGGTLEWSGRSDQKWIFLTPENGTNSGIISVNIDSANMEPGSHKGTIMINSNDGTITGTVLINITKPDFTVIPDPLLLNYVVQNPGESKTNTFTITKSESGTLKWSVSADQSWMTVSPETGIDSGVVTVSVRTAGMSRGVHEGKILVKTNVGSISGSINLKIEEPILAISPDPFSYSFDPLVVGDTASKTFSILNIGEGTLEWRVSADKPWISLTPASGANSGTVTLKVNTAGMSTGSQIGTITVESNGGVRKGSVNLNLVKPELKVSPDPVSLNFLTVCAGDSKSSQISISNSGTGTLTWNVQADKSWISLSPLSGTNSGTVNVNINTAGLSSGSNSGTIIISSNGGSKTGSVSLNVNTPKLFSSADNLDFGTLNTGDSSSKTITISNSGCGTLSWSASKNQPWITVSPTSGTNSGTVTVGVNTAGMSAGSYSGTITIDSNGGTKTINVYLQVQGLLVPIQVSPSDGSVFSHYPRTTTLQWNPVSGAISYTIEIQYCSPGGCGVWAADYSPVVTSDTSYTFNFVGAQPGRWRVYAVGAGGQESPKSSWWNFRYTI